MSPPCLSVTTRVQDRPRARVRVRPSGASGTEPQGPELMPKISLASRGDCYQKWLQ